MRTIQIDSVEERVHSPTPIEASNRQAELETEVTGKGTAL